MGFLKDKYCTKIRNDDFRYNYDGATDGPDSKKNTWFCLDDTCNKVKVGPG